MTSSGPEEFQYNGCCLLLCLSLGTVTQLTLVHPEIVSITFLPMVEFWTSFWLVMSDVYVPYADVCFLECNGGFLSHPQWQCISKEHRLHCSNGSLGLGRLSNSCACALMSVVLKPLLLKLYGTHVCHWCFREQDHDHCAYDISHHW